MRRAKYAIFLAFVLALATTGADVRAADGQASIHDCSVNAEQIVQCSVLTTDNATVRVVEVAGGGRKAEADFVPFEKSPQSVGVLILLDDSRSLDTAAFERLRALARQVVTSTQHRIGVYTFSRSLEVVGPLDTPRRTLELALNAVRLRGDSTEGFKAIIDANNLLRKVDVQSRLIVVLSDGDFEDTAYSVLETIKVLHESRTRLIGVSPLGGSAALTAAQPLRRLASETSGAFVVAQNSTAVEEARKAIVAATSSGGTIRFAPLATTTDVAVTTSSGHVARITYVAADWVDPVPVDAPPRTPPSALEAVLAWYKASLLHRIILWAGLLGIFLIVVVFVASVRSRRRLAAKQMLMKQVESAKKPVALAYFDMLDGDGSSYSITKSATTIGRQSDNDLVLRNTSVHRHHAVCNLGSEGYFSIVDLNTDNGVIVNGRRVSNAILVSGDVIELGEVRMRFRAV